MCFLRQMLSFHKNALASLAIRNRLSVCKSLYFTSLIETGPSYKGFNSLLACWLFPLGFLFCLEIMVLLYAPNKLLRC